MRMYFRSLISNFNIFQFLLIQQCANVMRNNKLLERETRRFYVNLFLKHGRNKTWKRYIDPRLLIKVFRNEL